jgi:hypothetical protein
VRLGALGARGALGALGALRAAVGDEHHAPGRGFGSDQLALFDLAFHRVRKSLADDDRIVVAEKRAEKNSPALVGDQVLALGPIEAPERHATHGRIIDSFAVTVESGKP